MTAPTPGLSGDEFGWEFRAGLTNEQFADWLVQRVRDAEAEALEKAAEAVDALPVGKGSPHFVHGYECGNAVAAYLLRERAAGVRGGAS